MAEVDLEVAVERSARSRAARWPERTAQNRLEPECWPEMNPRFNLVPGSTVFTIGSCFARNVEIHLANLGFDVPARNFLADNASLMGRTGDEILNKYTPPSIYQELVWTKRIRDRDGIVTDADIEPFLLDLGNGKVIDLQQRFTSQFGANREDALSQRRNLYQLFERAFDSEVVIITLGLIECWLDKTTGQYIEFGPYLRKHNSGGRFVFKRLTFPEAYYFTKKAIDLLNKDGARNVLITTSPVPLARTFTSDDVIIANTYSKSVLRAVAGQIAEEYANVDYFPSYESVMLTKQSYVWANDLTHVESEFVGRVVNRMCERYVVQKDSLPDATVRDEWLRFINLVNHKQFDAAREVFERIDPNHTRINPGARGLSLAVAEMLLHMGARDKAVAQAMMARDLALAAGERGCMELLRCARIFEAAGDAAEAAAARARATEPLRNPALVISVLRRLITSDALDDARLIVAHMEEHLADDPGLLANTAQLFETLKDFATAERLYRVMLKSAPKNADTLSRLGRLFFLQKKYKRAAAFYEKALARNPKDAAILKSLVPIYFELKQLEDAERSARALITILPLDPVGHLHLASSLRRGGRKSEALVHAKRAAELEPGNERYSRYVQELSG